MGNESKYAHYGVSKSQLYGIRKTFSSTMWINIALAILIAVVGIPMVANIASMLEMPDSLGSERYNEAEVFQIAYSSKSLTLYGVAVCVFFVALAIVGLGVVAAAQIRWASIAVVVLNTLMVGLMLAVPVPFRMLLLILFAFGAFLNLRCLVCYKELKMLKALPGYPHFSERMTETEECTRTTKLLERNLPAADCAVAPDGSALSGPVPAKGAPMDALAPVGEIAPLPPAQQKSMDLYRAEEPPVTRLFHEPVNLEKAPRVALSKHLPRESEVDYKGGVSPYDASNTEKEPLPTLKEIRRRYGQDGDCSKG